MTTLDDYRGACGIMLAACGPMAATGLARIDALAFYPPFLKMLLEALDALEREGLSYYITAGERTFPEQHALYLKGRSGVSGEKIVTTVDEGQSAHNYSVAADGVADVDLHKPGLQPSWDMVRLKHWADAATTAGLDAGYYWQNFVDAPHVQLKLSKYGLSPRNQLLAAHQQGGKLAVFQLLDRYAWL